MKTQKIRLSNVKNSETDYFMKTGELIINCNKFLAMLFRYY